jgi:SAM-dependent methyltransferase
VAGVPINLGDAEFFLVACDDCGLRYKDPPIDEEKLMKCYEAAHPSHWGERPDPHTRRFDVVRDLLQTHSRGRAILDVGCFNGAFLEWLSEDWEKSGVEPNSEAASIARLRGVDVVGTGLSDVVGRRRYDALALLDVVEHVSDPQRFFTEAQHCLNPDGMWVLVTADVDSFPWRLEGHRHWYCSLPEHVAFYSQRTMRWIGSELGMVNLESRLLSHHQCNLATQVIELAKNVSYAVIVYARGFGIPVLQSRVVGRRAPIWLSARDHRFYAMRTTES